MFFIHGLSVIFVILEYLLQQTSQTSIIILEETSDGCKPCYRKLFAGKRLAEIHIRRAVDCERIDECSRECDSEKGFLCEGFNYRQPGSRGSPRGRVRGTCELTSMPPSRIDVIHDIVTEPRYDYYERELSCDKKRPEPRPQTGWHDLKPQGDPYFHQRPVEVPRPLIPDRRPERPFHPPSISIRPIEDDVRFKYFRPGRPYLPEGEKFWRPRPQADFGPNEVEPHRHPGRRKDSPPVHGVYGGSYGYDTNYIDVPIRGTYPSHDKRRPLDNPGNGIYGGAFGYGESYAPVERDVVYGGSGRPDLCSVRSGAGFKLRRGIVRKSYLTPSLDHCENLCAVEKDCVCMTFSYRYSVAANAPSDNCLLSEVSYRDLDFYNDLEPDRDYDIYSMTGDHRSCEKEIPANERPPEECFWRVRSGCGVPPQVIRKTIVAQGLGDCEAECVEARQFTCRSFVYRYSEARPSHDESPNCFLSDWPSQEIDPLALPEVDGAELYQRGSFGRGCEPHPFPPLNNRGNRPGPTEPDNRPAKKDDVCYAEYQKPCRLTPEAVMMSCYVRSESECRERCSETRYRDPVPCMSFSYRTSNDRNDHNCHMSDVPRRDLRPGIDYVFGDGHLLFAWKEFEPHCDSGYSINIFIDDDRNSGRRPSHERPDYFEPPSKRPPRPHGRPYPPHPDFGEDRPGERPYGHGGGGGGGGGYGYGYGYGQDSRPGDRPNRPDRPDPVGPSYGPGGDRGMIESHGFYGGGGGYGYGQDSRPGDRPNRPDRPDPVGPSYGPGGDRGMIESHGFYGGGGGGGGGGSYPDGDGPGYSDERYNDVFHKHAGSTFQHFTVNGRPCKRGTKCERNKIAGFWSCEPEGAEYGSWDYCCEPKHHCGYSQGYHYPWCYVGPYEDQWRPCSEKYYPHIPISRPSRPSSDRWEEESHGEVPRPGLLGRHWPVAYLHSESPPNATDHLHRLRVSEDRRDRELPQGTGSGESKSTGNNRSGKVERILRYRGGKISVNLNDSRIRDSEIVKLADITEGLETRENETKSGDDDNWGGRNFLRIPTITPNETREGESKFEDYFEIVDVL